jgi:hypothetical protein
LEHLKRVLQRPDLGFAISLGTPGVHRKPVIQLTTAEGVTVGYVKVGWNEATNALVRNEAAVFDRVASTPFQSFIMPRCLYAGWWGERFLFVQSGPDGLVQSAPRNLPARYLAVLQELASLHTRWMFLNESTFWKNLLQRITGVKHAQYRHVLEQGLTKLEDSLADVRLPFHFCHGDFAPWNAKLLNGQLFLYDWEYADFEAPPVWDLFHFTVQTLSLLEKRTPGEIHKLVLRDGVQNESIRIYMEALYIKEDYLSSLLGLYTFDRLAFYAAYSDSDQETVRHFAKLSNLAVTDEVAIQ